MHLPMKSQSVTSKGELCRPCRKQTCCISLTGELSTAVVRYHYGINELTTELHEEDPEQLRVLRDPEDEDSDTAVERTQPTARCSQKRPTDGG